MEINILHCVEGAKKAEGITVIIDVFRAFSVEAYCVSCGAKEVIPVGDAVFPLEYQKSHDNVVTIGERWGIKLEGFDFGNSPTEIINGNIAGKTVVHTTSAGTQGVENAKGADEILTGSLVNAKAIANYIKSKNPDKVSLVAMGLMGEEQSAEDELCAKYIKSILEGNELDISNDIEELRVTSGKKFFEEEYKDIFPREDFGYCTDLNKFNFVLKINRENGLFKVERIDM